MHAFDLAKLRGPAVVVRRAKQNEQIVTVDGVTRKLTPEMTAICDAERPQIVAGVMGSAESEVTAATTDIVLEAAYFQPTRIRRTRRALGLSSESSYRFERGIDMLGLPDAIARACDLIVALAGGEVREPPLDLWPEPHKPRSVFLREARVGRLLSGLVPGVAHHWGVGSRDIRLFELGTVFRESPTGARPIEELSLAIVLTGARHPSYWSDATGGAGGAKLPDMDIWDLKQHFELAVGIAAPSCDVQPAASGAGWVAVGRNGGQRAGTATPLDADAPKWAGPLFGLEVRIAVAPLPLARYR